MKVLGILKKNLAKMARFKVYLSVIAMLIQ